MRWKKKNGNEIEVNDEQATIDYCESLGWERLDGKSKKAKPKKPELTNDEKLAEAQRLETEGKVEEADILLDSIKEK